MKKQLAPHISAHKLVVVRLTGPGNGSIAIVVVGSRSNSLEDLGLVRGSP